MSSNTGKVRETEAQARAWRQYGRASMSKPPAVKEGERLMSIERVVGESSDDACVRASRLGWCGGMQAPGMVNCAACLEGARQERARLKQSGKCLSCRRPLEPTDESRCAQCRARISKREQVDYEANRDAILATAKAKRVAKGMTRKYSCRVCGADGCDARSHTAEEIAAAQARDPNLRSFFCTVCGELGHNKRRHQRDAVEVEATEVYAKRVIDTLKTLGRPVTRIELAKAARASSEGIRLATNALVAAGRVVELDGRRFGRRMGIRVVQLKATAKPTPQPSLFDAA